jgi:hypothetical protein
VDGRSPGADPGPPATGRVIRNHQDRAGPGRPSGVVTASGMAGWQITLIALRAALLAAAATLVLDRTWAARRAASAARA